MPDIEWYGPPFGKGSTGDRVSHTTPVVDALRSKANEIGRTAAFLLDARSRHRTGDSQVKVVHYPKTDLDSVIELHDPDGKGGSAGIEMEHHVLRDAVRGA